MHRHQIRNPLLPLTILLTAAASVAASATPAAPAASTRPAARDQTPITSDTPSAAPTQDTAPPLHCIVLNEAHAGIADTRLRLHTVGPAGWMPVGGRRTDTAGAADLPFPGDGPGPLLLKARAPGYKPAHALYLPEPGEVVPWVTIVLRGDRHLQGAVVNEQDEPVGEALVTVNTPAGRREIRSDVHGRFEMQDLMPVRATVRVEVPGIGSGSYRVDLAEPPEPIRIVLRPQRQVTLRLLDAQQNPVPDATVDLQAPKTAELVTDDTGRVSIPGIGAEGARLRVSLDDNFYRLDEDPLDVYIQEGSDPMEVELFAIRGGCIRGQVVEQFDDQTYGVPAATVWLVEGGRIGRNVTCDEDGHFRITAVAPDEYTVAAGHPTYATAARQARVRTQQQVELQFTLDYGKTVRGKVIGVNGEPVGQAIVRVLGWYPPSESRDDLGPVELPWRATRAGAQGEFVVRNLPAGRLKILASESDNTHPTMVDLHVPAEHDIVETSIRLTAGKPQPPM